jgi:hypothetical protein
MYRQSLTIDIKEAMRRGLGRRFESYAKRLCVYQVDNDCGTVEPRHSSHCIDKSVLSCWNALSHLFPRVQHMVIRMDVPCLQTDPAVLGSFLASGRLSSMTLELDNSISIYPDTIDEFKRACSTLKVLYINGHIEEHSLWHKHIGTILSSTTALHTFEASAAMNPANIRLLANNPGLRHLKLYNCVVEAPAVTPSWPARAFSLETLSVMDWSSRARLACSLLAARASPCLVECTIFLNGQPIAGELRTICELLATHATTMKWLEIVIPADLHDTIAFADVSSLLQGFKQLAALTLPRCMVPSLSVDQLTELVHSCPQLTYWAMNESYDSALNRPQCTLPLANFLTLLEARPQTERLPVIVSMRQAAALRPEQLCTSTYKYNSALDVVDARDIEDAVQLVRQFFPDVYRLRVWQENGHYHEVGLQVTGTGDRRVLYCTANYM